MTFSSYESSFDKFGVFENEVFQERAEEKIRKNSTYVSISIFLLLILSYVLPCIGLSNRVYTRGKQEEMSFKTANLQPLI